MDTISRFKEACAEAERRSQHGVHGVTISHELVWELINESTTLRAELDNIKTSWALLHAENAELRAKLAAMETKAKQLITKACCNAVEKLTELAPNQGWDSGEVVAEMYIRELREMLSASPAPSNQNAESVDSFCERNCIRENTSNGSLIAFSHPEQKWLTLRGAKFSTDNRKSPADSEG